VATPQRRGNTRRARVLRARVLRGATLCELCGKTLDKTLAWPDPMSPTVDHREPWAHAPHLRYALDNLRPAHLVCNQKRGTGQDQPPPPRTRDW
jgi:5-methylcytosine-specific restriction endonuclease McrA